MNQDNERQAIGTMVFGQREMLAEAALQPGGLIAAPPRQINAVPFPGDDDNASGYGVVSAADGTVASSAAPMRPYMTDVQIDNLAKQFLARFPIGDDYVREVRGQEDAGSRPRERSPATTGRGTVRGGTGAGSEAGEG